MTREKPNTLQKQRDSYRVHKKLAGIPKDAQISKRPLQRPQIASSYASKNHPKIVYVSAKTHFMSAVKRVEKLLNQSENRAVQSATAQARSTKRKNRTDRSSDQGDDEIVRIAKALQETRKGETVVAKGTGKAILKAMSLGLWFQERPLYTVSLKTGTISAIDDVQTDQDIGLDSTTNDPLVRDANVESALEGKHTGLLDLDPLEEATGDYSRVRQLSVLEVHIRIR